MSAPAPPSAPSADNVRVCVRVRPNTAPDRDGAWSVSDAGALLQLDAAGKAHFAPGDSARPALRPLETGLRATFMPTAGGSDPG